MTNDEKLLWNSISKFQFDEPGSDLRFSQRLARENRWPLKYALDAIEEYRRFIFLCCVSKNGATPSDQVDQVWHLHLTYTKSYWKEFCGKVLGRELHHNPTKGGASEREKFTDYYSQTLTLYEQKFGVKPHTNFWPGNDQRFSETHFQRVNAGKYFLIPRFRFARTIKFAMLLFGGLICMQAMSSKGFASLLMLAVIIGLISFFFKGGGGSSGSSGGCSGFLCSNSNDSGCSSDGCSGCGGGGCGGGD